MTTLSFVKKRKTIYSKVDSKKREQRMFSGCSRAKVALSHFCRHNLHERRDNALVEPNRENK